MDLNILIIKIEILKLFIGKFAFIYILQCFQNSLHIQMDLTENKKYANCISYFTTLPPVTAFTQKRYKKQISYLFGVTLLSFLLY